MFRPNFASHRDNPFVAGVPMRITILETGVPGKTEEMQLEKGCTGDLIADNPGEVGCHGPQASQQEALVSRSLCGKVIGE